MTLSSTLNFGSYTEAKAQVAAKKLGILSKSRHYFRQEQLLNLYQAQVRSCLEYCSHLWDGSAKYQLEALETIERRAKRLIDDDLLCDVTLNCKALVTVERLQAYRSSIGYILGSMRLNYTI